VGIERRGAEGEDHGYHLGFAAGITDLPWTRAKQALDPFPPGYRSTDGSATQDVAADEYVARFKDSFERGYREANAMSPEAKTEYQMCMYGSLERLQPYFTRSADIDITIVYALVATAKQATTEACLRTFHDTDADGELDASGPPRSSAADLAAGAAAADQVCELVLEGLREHEAAAWEEGISLADDEGEPPDDAEDDGTGDAGITGPDGVGDRGDPAAPFASDPSAAPPTEPAPMPTAEDVGLVDDAGATATMPTAEDLGLVDDLGEMAPLPDPASIGLGLGYPDDPDEGEGEGEGEGEVSLPEAGALEDDVAGQPDDGAMSYPDDGDPHAADSDGPGGGADDALSYPDDDEVIDLDADGGAMDDRSDDVLESTIADDAGGAVGTQPIGGPGA
jgi:hypothetical protein